MKKIILLILLIGSQNLFAESIFINAVERYETRKSAQWLLIQPERKFSLFEQWFAFNAAEKFRSYPWEVFLGFEYGGLTRKNDYWPSFDTDDSIYSYYATFYYSIFGLGFRRERAADTYKQWEIVGNVRILGFNVQTSNLVFQLGNRWLTDEFSDDSFSNFFIGVDAQLYVFRWLGVEFIWRSYFGDEGDKTGRDIRSTRLALSLFAEIDFFRIYYEWHTENFNEDGLDRNAGLFGVRLYY